MKKYVSFIIIIGLLMMAGLSSSEGLEYAAMSDEQLLRIRENVENELNKRSIKEYTLIEIGCYIAGEDIKAGKYVIRNKAELGEVETQSAQVLIFDAKIRSIFKIAEFTDKLIESKFVGNDEEKRIRLDEGQTLVISWNDVYIMPASEKGLFMD